MVLLSSVSAQYRHRRKQVAVVLSGGGAKGTAHIGALKVIEEAGIPVDYVVGTSMGAIVGGLYSIGYNAHQLDSILSNQDWSILLADQLNKDRFPYYRTKELMPFILSVPFMKFPGEVVEGGLLKGKNIEALFNQLTAQYADSLDFDQLPIPFACVSQNLVNGDEVVFHDGYLAKAMRASMAIPGVFTPVYKDSLVLIDGGMINNYPVDVARSMGADIIIGVDVQSDLMEAKNLSSAMSVLGQLINISGKAQYQLNVDQTDIYIKVNVDGFSAASFNKTAIDTLVARGEDAARAKFDDMVKLRNMLGIEDVKPRPDYIVPDWALYFMRDSIQQHKAPSNYLSLGARFDNEDMAALILNGTIQVPNLRNGSYASLTARLGKILDVEAKLAYEPIKGWFISPSYIFNHRDFSVYDADVKCSTVTFNRNILQLDFVHSWRHLLIGFGLKYDNVYYTDYLSSDGVASVLDNEHLIKYFFRVEGNTMNKRSFPTSGGRFRTTYELVTDNMYKYDNEAPVSTIAAFGEVAFPISKRFTILPSAATRFIVGNNYSMTMANWIGGRNPYGTYLDSQMPFYGINKMEAINKIFVQGSCRANLRIMDNNYLVAATSVGWSGVTLSSAIESEGETLYGGMIGWGYNTSLGPIEASLNFSNRTKNVGLLLSFGLMF